MRRASRNGRGSLLLSRVALMIALRHFPLVERAQRNAAATYALAYSVFLSSAALAQVVPVRDGLWNDPLTWQGTTVPGATTVNITGYTVTLATPIAVGGL